MELTLLAVMLAVSTALGFRIFRALAAGEAGIASRPVMATLGTTALFAPAVAFLMHSALFALAIIALAALIYFAGYFLRIGADAAA
ncbi:hypothetical protein IZ6_30030 [Terrihabitans soli]|uniref:Uncharacterized protein n=1 Tax=Terrihabitans soli TaxID=708113 RepID=A0A6S6QZY6_9HYPH|nr:hypothetical protein [Terrihabitans soli]BCJ92268.1 hypothetical protein IZ6_30030 [Terrihabitans soli]